MLLLNSVLTVAPGSPASHAGKGWEAFTDRVIAELSARREGIVFLLWGPYSASNGFFGCRHFSRANALLTEAGHVPVDWRLS